MDTHSDDDPSTGRRPVLTPQARELYLSIVAAGGQVRVGPDDCADDAFDRSALDSLVGLGLLVQHFDDEFLYVAVDPQQPAVRLSTTWHAEAMERLDRIRGLPAELAELTEAYRLGRSGGSAVGAVEYASGKMTINALLEPLVSSCHEEMLTVQPGGARRARTLQNVIDRDLSVLHRGAQIRTLYQPGARHDPATRQYVATITEAGGRVRTLDDSFDRLIVIDRKVAVIPVARDTNQAAFVRDHAMLNYLIGMFERLWERGWDFTGKGGVPQEVATHLHATILGMLRQGLSMRQISTRLGMAERTVARQVAELREKYGADTLFQLGWHAAESMARTEHHAR